eukprot:jgi/Chlat1/710/Chrsp104S01299
MAQSDGDGQDNAVYDSFRQVLSEWNSQLSLQSRISVLRDGAGLISHEDLNLELIRSTTAA